MLHLPTVRAAADELAAAAVRDRVTHRAYLAELLASEVDDREARRRERRIAEARFPRIKRLAEFDLGATPSIAPGTLAALATGDWISAGEPVVLLGDSGTGKTHLLIGLGIAACPPGRLRPARRGVGEGVAHGAASSTATRLATSDGRVGSGDRERSASS